MKNRFAELRRGSWSMPEGRQKVAVLEEMILIADKYMTEQDAYNARISYLSAAQQAGCREKIIVAFAWCLARYERAPADYSAHQLLWYYKWVLNEIWRMPELGLEHVGGVFEDFKRKCEEHGYSLRPYYQQKVNFMLSQGMMNEAVECYKLWRAAPRDALSDCRACEQNLFGQYDFKMNRNRKGLRTIKPILDGKMSCQSIPQNTYSQAIVPLLKLKEYEHAAAIAKKALRLIKGPQYLEEHGIFLEFHTITDLSKASKIYNETIRYALESRVAWDRLNYFLAARVFLAEWGKKKRRKKLAEWERVTPEWLDNEVAILREAFNRRNGNTYMTQLMADKDKHIRRLLAAYPS